MTTPLQQLTHADQPTIINLTYLKRHSDEVIDRAHSGETFIVTHRGVEKAAIVPYLLFKMLSKKAA
jgi:prevent-host-death family protein